MSKYIYTEIEQRINSVLVYQSEELKGLSETIGNASSVL